MPSEPCDNIETVLIVRDLCLNRVYLSEPVQIWTTSVPFVWMCVCTCPSALVLTGLTQQPAKVTVIVERLIGRSDPNVA